MNSSKKTPTEPDKLQKLKVVLDARQYLCRYKITLESKYFQ